MHYRASYSLSLPLIAVIILGQSAGCPGITINTSGSQAPTQSNTQQQQQQQAQTQAPEQQNAPAAVQAEIHHEQLTNRESLDAQGTRARLFEFREPAGTMCDIISDNSWMGTTSREIPFNFEARTDDYLTFECVLPDGREWRQRKLPKDQTRIVVSLGESGPATAGQPATAARAPAAQSAGAPMGSQSFNDLASRVDDASFSADKLSTIEVAANANFFTSAQVARLVELLTMSDDQVQVVRLTHHRIVDPENHHVILDTFRFSSSRDEAQTILLQ